MYFISLRKKSTAHGYVVCVLFYVAHLLPTQTHKVQSLSTIVKKPRKN